MKTCSKCRQSLPLDAFHKGSGKFGRHGYCKACGKVSSLASSQKPAIAERNRARARAWGAAHPERVAERCRRYRAMEPDAMRVWHSRHRAKKGGVTSTLTLAEWLAVVAAHDGKCAYCGESYESIDHVIPMALDGPNTKENVVPACAWCNNSKHDKLPDEWQRPNRAEPQLTTGAA